MKKYTDTIIAFVVGIALAEFAGGIAYYSKTPHPAVIAISAILSLTSCMIGVFLGVIAYLNVSVD